MKLRMYLFNKLIRNSNPLLFHIIFAMKKTSVMSVCFDLDIHRNSLSSNSISMQISSLHLEVKISQEHMFTRFC